MRETLRRKWNERWRLGRSRSQQARTYTLLSPCEREPGLHALSYDVRGRWSSEECSDSFQCLTKGACQLPESSLRLPRRDAANVFSRVAVTRLTWLATPRHFMSISPRACAPHIAARAATGIYIYTQNASCFDHKVPSLIINTHVNGNQRKGALCLPRFSSVCTVVPYLCGRTNTR